MFLAAIAIVIIQLIIVSIIGLSWLLGINKRIAMHHKFMMIFTAIQFALILTMITNYVFLTPNLSSNANILNHVFGGTLIFIVILYTTIFMGSREKIPTKLRLRSERQNLLMIIAAICWFLLALSGLIVFYQLYL